MLQNGQATATALDAGGDDLVGAVDVDALAVVLLHEHAAAAGAAAEAVLLAARQLLDAARHADRGDHVARRVELAVPAAEVAAVVIGDRVDRRLLGLELAAP